MLSTRFSFRARVRDQRGFALILALVIAILYFALIELLMIDANRELGEARRFRSRIIALTLAENGAELAARGMIALPSNVKNEENEQGTMTGDMRIGGGDFTIVGTGESKVPASRSKVTLKGSVDASNNIKIIFAQHTYD